MNFNIKFYPRAEKDLDKIPQNDRLRILKSLLSLQKDPHIGKKLKGEFTGYYSIRVWPYRIIYCIVNKECLIVVIRIGHC